MAQVEGCLANLLEFKPQYCQISQAWQHTSVIPALRRLRQEDLEFEVSLTYTVRLCFKI
jgi:hypothetical protein